MFLLLWVKSQINHQTNCIQLGCALLCARCGWVLTLVLTSSLRQSYGTFSFQNKNLALQTKIIAVLQLGPTEVWFEYFSVQMNRCRFESIFFWAESQIVVVGFITNRQTTCQNFLPHKIKRNNLELPLSAYVEPFSLVLFVVYLVLSRLLPLPLIVRQNTQ